jgi:hypothetical protein
MVGIGWAVERTRLRQGHGVRRWTTSALRGGRNGSGMHSREKKLMKKRE